MLKLQTAPAPNPNQSASDENKSNQTTFRLVRKLPQPRRKIIGDLSDIVRVLVGLDLRVAV
jgi:hypothetical protein